MQKFTSATTSINKSKLPRAYGADIPAGASVLDYGCGRWTKQLEEAAKAKGWRLSLYDPFNLPGSQPNFAEYVICSNVLNVIDDDSDVNLAIINCLYWATKGVVFSVYEGDGSGVGRQTGADQWQRNEKTAEYVKRIKRFGFKVTRKGGLIYVDGRKKA